jgi:hypothetical protein
MKLLMLLIFRYAFAFQHGFQAALQSTPLKSTTGRRVL